MQSNEQVRPILEPHKIEPNSIDGPMRPDINKIESRIKSNEIGRKLRLEDQSSLKWVFVCVSSKSALRVHYEFLSTSLKYSIQIHYCSLTGTTLGLHRDIILFSLFDIL